MHFGFYDGIIAWLGLWGTYWWVYVYVLNPKGVDHLRHYLLSAVYFLLAAGSIIYLFNDYFSRLIIDGWNGEPIFWLILLCAFDVLAYHALRRVRHGQRDFVDHHPHAEFLAINDRYLISKSAEIVFQQTLIILLALILQDAGLGLNGIRLMFAIVFTFAHLPILLIDGWGMGSFFVTAAAIASIFFPALILNVQYGFIYSFMLHQVFYVVSGLTFWLYWGGREHLRLEH